MSLQRNGCSDRCSVGKTYFPTECQICRSDCYATIRVAWLPGSSSAGTLFNLYPRLTRQSVHGVCHISFLVPLVVYSGVPRAQFQWRSWQSVQRFARRLSGCMLFASSSHHALNSTSQQASRRPSTLLRTETRKFRATPLRSDRRGTHPSI